MSPALPFLCLGLAPLWSRAPLLGRAVLGALALWGAAVALVCVATTAQPPELVQRPVEDLLWPAFRCGDLSLNHQSFFEAGSDWEQLRDRPPAEHDAWNVGEALGLHGLGSLAPLGVVWAGCAAAFARATSLKRGKRESR